MSEQITVNEMAESLTGYDEIAIEKHMGIDVYADAEQKGVKALRALVFVSQRRQGKTDAEAVKAAMNMSLKEANSYFSEDADELIPEEPETASGKEGSQPN